MAQEEIFNQRDRSYSAWHRRQSTGRFVGIEKAQLLAMIDLDASLYVEYNDGAKDPLALIETARDVGQTYKTATVTLNLAQRANLPCYVVLYTLSDQPNPYDRKFYDIKQFRVRRLHPAPVDSRWRILQPDDWARELLELRLESAARVDNELYKPEALYYQHGF